MDVRERIDVRGRVQGVGFRYTVMMMATEKGLVGWVRNNDDYSVSLEIQGPQELIRQFRKELKEPKRFIRIDHLNYHKIALKDEHEFRIIG